MIVQDLTISEDLMEQLKLCVIECMLCNTIFNHLHDYLWSSNVAAKLSQAQIEVLRQIELYRIGRHIGKGIMTQLLVYPADGDIFGDTPLRLPMQSNSPQAKKAIALISKRPGLLMKIFNDFSMSRCPVLFYIALFYIILFEITLCVQTIGS